MAFAIKAEVNGPLAKLLVFKDQKTMYDGRKIAEDDLVYIFANENEGGTGLVAVGIVTSAEATARAEGVPRQTPRVSITVRNIGPAKRRLGRGELGAFANWEDGRPETELNFKFYRQATNKIVGLSDRASSFLATYFESGAVQHLDGQRASKKSTA